MRLVSIANQIDANIKRTAFSPYIYEYNDFAVGLTGAEGQLVGAMHRRHAAVRGRFGRHGGARRACDLRRGRLHHGDVVVCNHAAVQGQHLNNTVMYTPIYAGPNRESLIGFFAINVHWIDIGGIAARFDRHLHGRAAAALDQAVVEGRADRGGLPHHREQHPHAARADGRHRGAARRLPVGARPDGRARRQIRRRDLRARRGADPRPVRGGGARLHRRHAGRRLPGRDLSRQRPLRRRRRCRSGSRSWSRATR